MPVNRSGVIGGPDLSSGTPTPAPGIAGPGGTSGIPAAPSDAYFLLTTANSALPNGVVYSGPVTYTNSGFPPASTTALWGDYSVSPTAIRYYDVPTATWIDLPSTGGGNAILNGSGVPGSGTGSNGDYYINLSGGAGNGDLYQKQSGAWVLVGNIAGATGASINPLGVWAGGTTYHIGDVVTYLGAGYIAVTTSTGVTPGTDPTKWQIIVDLPALKRRLLVTFQMPGTSFAGSIDDSQIWIMPYGEGNASLTWVPSRLTLYCSGVATPPHSASVQVYSNTEPSLSGSPTSLTGTLTLTATSSHASWSAYTVTFSGSPSVPSGDWIMAEWSNDLNITNCWAALELEATVNTA